MFMLRSTLRGGLRRERGISLLAGDFCSSIAVRGILRHVAEAPCQRDLVHGIKRPGLSGRGEGHCNDKTLGVCTP
jgi:hypothetical protein